MRPPRIQAANATYHVTCRGNRRDEIVRDDDDRRRFLAIVRSVGLRLDWSCHFYCLMTNHYHLLVTTPEPNLAIGMHAINFTAAKRFSKRHGYTSHLFERRYKSTLVSCIDSSRLLRGEYVFQIP